MAFKIFGVVYIGAIVLLNCVACANLITSPSAFTADIDDQMNNGSCCTDGSYHTGICHISQYGNINGIEQRLNQRCQYQWDCKKNDLRNHCSLRGIDRFRSEQITHQNIVSSLMQSGAHLPCETYA